MHLCVVTKVFKESIRGPKGKLSCSLRYPKTLGYVYRKISPVSLKVSNEYFKCLLLLYFCMQVSCCVC